MIQTSQTLTGVIRHTIQTSSRAIITHRRNLCDAVSR